MSVKTSDPDYWTTVFAAILLTEHPNPRLSLKNHQP